MDAFCGCEPRFSAAEAAFLGGELALAAVELALPDGVFGMVVIFATRRRIAADNQSNYKYICNLGVLPVIGIGYLLTGLGGFNRVQFRKETVMN